MNKERIELGDIVDVRFERIESINNAKVLHLPQNTGDSWWLKTSDGKITYVQLFGRMDLIKKEES